MATFEQISGITPLFELQRFDTSKSRGGNRYLVSPLRGSLFTLSFCLPWAGAHG
jgi:hypothetical protein